MSDYKPITGELRAKMQKWGWVERDGSIMFTTSPIPFSIDAEQTLAISGSDFDRLCDRIDAIHAQLERENAALRERLAEMNEQGADMHGGGSSSITDELKEWVKSLYTPNSGELKLQAERIADRIDAEHERECKEQYACGAEHGIGASIDASMIQTHGYVELPKDADGEYIHIGDRMEWVRYKDDDPTVVRTVSGIGNGVFFAWSDEQGRYAQYEAHAYRHHHAPTVEDVLREFALKVAGEECMTMRTGVVEEFAAKLRLAESEDA